MSNKLSLLVNFIGVDKMSGALRSIVGLGRNGSTSLKALNGEAKKLGREMKDVQKALAGASGNVSDLMNRERELERAIAGVNHQIERQKRIEAINADTRAMQRRGEDLKSKGQDNVLGGVAMATPFILATKSAAEFTSGMVDIQQKAELTDRATQNLGNRIVQLADLARQMPEDMRSGLDALLSKGMSLDAATAAIGPAGRLATTYKVELPDAANAAFASITNLKVAAGETSRIFDAMAAAGNAGGFEVRDMARYFPSLTAQMQALGEKGMPAVADLSAALQVAMHTAGNADEAGNNIQNLLGKINAPGTISAFKKNFGIDLPAAMKKLQDQGYSSLEAIALVTKKATGGDMKKLGFAFEDQQARMGILALLQNMDEYRKIRASAMQSGGTVDRQFNQRVARDATVQWRAFLGSASSLAIVLGTTLLPAMTQVLGYLSQAGSAIGAWAQRNPQLAGQLTQLAAGLVAARIGFGALQFAAGSILGPMASVWSLFAKARVLGTVASLLPQIASGFTLLTGPIGLTVLAIAGVAFAVYRYWGPISGWVRSHWTQIRNVMLGAMVIFTPMIAAVVFAASMVYRNWGRIKAATVSMVGALARIAEPIIRPWMIVQGFLAGLVGRFFQFGVNIVGGLIRGIASMTGSVIKAFLNLAGSVGARFAAALGIHSPSRVFMAYGGHIAGGLALGVDKARRGPIAAVGRMATGVAAAGAISLTPVQAAARSAGPAAAATAGPITITINGAPGQDVRQLAKEVMRELERAQGVKARASYEGAR